MTQPNQAVAGFFGGAGKTAKFPEVGTTVSGTITAVSAPEPQTDIKTGAPIPGKEQIRISLQTDERDPQDPDDDGRRTVFVKGWMRGAIGDALRRAGAAAPEVGGKLSIAFTSERPPEIPGFNPTKLFEATYEKPSTAATAGFFGPTGSGSGGGGVAYTTVSGGGGSGNGGAPVSGSPMATGPASTVTSGPAKPAAISQASWDKMDPATRQAVASTMSGLNNEPPF